MKVDAQHFWAYGEHPDHYVWMSDNLAPLRRDDGSEDLLTLMGEEGIEATSAVEVRDLPEETGYLLALAAEHAFLRGVVGWLDLCELRIERMAAAPRLKGLRMLVHDRSNPDFAARVYRLEARS